MTTKHILPMVLSLLCGCAPDPRAEAPDAESVMCPASIADWASGTSYTAGGFVRYHGTVYRCVQSHTSLDSWAPDVVPALWQAVTCGSTSGGGTTGGGTTGGGTTGGGTTGCGTTTGGGTTGGGTTGGGTTGGGTTGGGTTGGGTTGGGTTGTGGASGLVFSAYKDTSINMDWNTNVASTMVSGSRVAVAGDLTQNGSHTLTLAFATGECGSENWGGVPGAAMATANVPLLTAAGVDYILSTGGAAGSFSCSTDAGMKTFLDRWASDHLIGVDFDIEAGQSQSVITDLVTRIKAAHAAYPKLRFSLTLATLANNNGASTAQSLGSGIGSSLNFYGDNTLAAMKSVFGASWPSYVTVNLMTMDYGSPGAGVCVVSGGACQMGQSALQAAYNLRDHFGVPFSAIELTPMIGGNDVAGEQFTLADADTVAKFAIANGLAGVHYWSYDRDIDCPAGAASPTCNSLGGAGAHGFLKRFLAAGLK